MKQYFRLNPYCYLIEGSNGSCIYNLSTGDMIALDKAKSELLGRCEKNVPLKDIQDVDYDFIEKLYNMGLGRFSEAPAYIEKLYVDAPPLLESITNTTYRIENVFVELDTMCNFDCVFCKKDDNTLYRKTGCKRWKSENKISDISIWKNVISQIANLGCKQITFIGGEPFLNFGLLKELVSQGKEHNISRILIFTNGSVLNSEILDFIKQYNIELNIQLLGATNETYQKITGFQDMNDQILNNVKLLAASNVNYSITMLLNKLNENQVEDMIKQFAAFTNPQKIRMDYIYPIPQNDYYSDKFIDVLYNKKKLLQKVDVNRFCYSKKYNSCYGNQLAITAEGDVIPCIMSRGLVLGNIKHDSIVSILKNSQYEYYQRLTKDHIEECKDCSLRYGCFDCRAIEMSAMGKLHGLEYCAMKPSKQETTNAR